MYAFARIAALAGALLVVACLGSCNKARLGGNGGRYSDSELRGIKGVQVSTTGYETTFRIPWMYTWQGDKEILFKRLAQSYVESIGGLRDEFLGRKIKVKGFEKATLIAEYNDQIRAVLDTFAVDAGKDPSIREDAAATADAQPPEIYMDVSKQNLVQSYLLPQAVSIFGAGNFTTPDGLQKPIERATGGIINTININVAFVYVAQLFVVVTIDNHSKREKLGPDGTPVRGYQVDGSLLLMPSGGPGRDLALTDGAQDMNLAGAAAGAWNAVKQGAQTFGKACMSVGKVLPMQFGLGLVWGPLDSPHDLMGYSGLSFDFDGSVRTQGLFARFVALGKFGKAPLFFTFLGADCKQGGGTSAAMALTVTTFMDPVTLTHWISGGADARRIKNAAAVDQLRREAKQDSSLPGGSSVDFSL